MTQPRQDKLIFLDLETTGLDPRDDKILEIGMIVTNQDFDILGTFSRVIKFDVLDNNGEENYIDDDVLEMHSENGLWDECKNGALITDVER